MKYKISNKLYLDKSEGKGLGVYTNRDILANKIIEKSSVLVLNPEERKSVEQTALNNYIFEWNDDNLSCCVAFGYISMYNHSYTSNCEYIMDFENKYMVIKTVRDIAAGEELTINYNGDWNSDTPLWFDVI